MFSYYNHKKQYKITIITEKRASLTLHVQTSIALVYVLHLNLLRHNHMPVHEILVLIAYASSEGSDDPAHERSPLRAFAARARNIAISMEAQIKF